MPQFQSLLRIGIPDGEQPIRASGFREMLAKAGDGSPLLPPAFFNYREDGRPIPADPDIRTVGGRSWVGILSKNGDDHLFNMAVGIASSVVSKHYGMPAKMMIDHPEYSIAATDDPKHYYIRDMAIKCRSDRRKNISKASVEDLVKEVVLAGLKKEATRCGFDLPPDDHIGLQVKNLRQIGLRLVTAHGATNEYLPLINGECSMFLKLNGIWQFGSLQARGYGRLVWKGDRK